MRMPDEFKANGCKCYWEAVRAICDPDWEYTLTAVHLDCPVHMQPEIVCKVIAVEGDMATVEVPEEGRKYFQAWRDGELATYSIAGKDLKA